MYWQEEHDDTHFVVPENVVDVTFDIACRTLPVDHAYALAEALREPLPWFHGDETSGLHVIHGADSGNGWERPEEGDATLYLSRRTKLRLRVPRHRADDAAALSGQTLNVAGSIMEVGANKMRLLSTSTTLYSRYVVADPSQEEDVFVEEAVARLRELGLKFKKVLCGKQTSISMPDGALAVRSLLISDLGPEDSVRLQEEGLGSHRKLGCGLFIPHKSV